MTALWVDYLIEQDKAPLEEVRKVVRGRGARAAHRAVQRSSRWSARTRSHSRLR